MTPLGIAVSIVLLIVGILIGYIYRKNIGEKAIGSAEMQAKNMLLDAQNTAENLKKEKILEASLRTSRSVKMVSQKENSR